MTNINVCVDKNDITMNGITDLSIASTINVLSSMFSNLSSFTLPASMLNVESISVNIQETDLVRTSATTPKKEQTGFQIAIKTKQINPCNPVFPIVKVKVKRRKNG